MNVAEQAQTDAVRTGAVTYLAASVETSLYRNGKVLVRRDSEGNDTPWEGTERDKQQVLIHDARGLAGPERRTLGANGFEMLERPLAAPHLDFLDHEQVVRSYYPHCADIVRAHTGARIVKAFDHNVRSAFGKLSGASHRGRAAGAASRACGARRLHADQRAAAPARPRQSSDRQRHLPQPDGRRRNATRQGGCRARPRFRPLRAHQCLAEHRRGAGRDPSARALRCGQRASGRPGRVRDPLRRPHRRELLREARRRSSLVLLSRHDPRRSAADQAVGFGGRAWRAPRAQARTR